MIGRTIEDYLKAIYKLKSCQRRATTSAIARKLGVSDPTVSEILKKLAKEKYLKHISYRGVVLTDKGEKLAIDVIRKHRIVELFLNEILGLAWDKVHVEAEKLEHVISEEVLARMDYVLGYPKVDPHGDPIPSGKGEIENVEIIQTLAETEVGEPVAISRVSDDDPGKLRIMAGLGLYPSVHLRITDKFPFDGDITVKVGKLRHRLPRDVAENIYVTQTE